MKPRPEPAGALLDTEDIDLEATPSWAVAYRACRARPHLSVHPLSSVEARPSLQAFLALVIQSEAPVHRDLVYRRVRDAFGVGRVGSIIKSNIEFVAGRLTIDGQPVTLDSAGFFRLGPARTVRSPEADDDVRTVAQTPQDEMDLAVWLLTTDAVTIDNDALVSAVRQVFGWRRAGAEIQLAVLSSIDRCLASGTIYRSPTGSLVASAG